MKTSYGNGFFVIASSADFESERLLPLAPGSPELIGSFGISHRCFFETAHSCGLFARFFPSSRPMTDGPVADEVKEPLLSDEMQRVLSPAPPQGFVWVSGLGQMQN
jgi:hypothetical protein